MGFYDKSKVKQNKPVAAEPVPNPLNTAVIPDKEPEIVSPDEELIDRKYVINTQNNMTGVNTLRRHQIIELLKGYAEGSSLKVTYYKEHYSETDFKGKLDSTEHELNPVHKSVLKIHGMELRLTAPLQYEHNNNDVISFLSGEALTYPGFKPEKGDSFVMEVDTGKYGLMEVVEIPQRTSIRASTYYKISFHLTHWLSESEILEVENGIVDEAWFDKTRFLAEPGALLYHDEYVTMHWMRDQRTKMVTYYQNTFLDEIDMYSYVRPDKVYDPYLTDFVRQILDFTETSTYATQLYEGAPFLRTSIFRAILDSGVPLQSVPIGSNILTYVLGSKSVLVNSLINRRYLEYAEGATLQDYFDNEAFNNYIKLSYPKDFKVIKTEYVKTTDAQPIPWKTYFETADGETYTVYEFKPEKVVDMTKLYEQVNTYGFKEDIPYYTRKDGVFSLVDTSDPNAVADKGTDYYTTKTAVGGGVAPDGEIPANPDLPSIPEGDEYDERVLGDLMLHLHPHYSECLCANEDGSSSGTSTTDALMGILWGTNEHIDLMRGFLLRRSIDVAKLRACINAVWKLPKMEQFYKMAVYIFLAAKCIDMIHHNEKIFD